MSYNYNPGANDSLEGSNQQRSQMIGEGGAEWVDPHSPHDGFLGVSTANPLAAGIATEDNDLESLRAMGYLDATQSNVMPPAIVQPVIQAPTTNPISSLLEKAKKKNESLQLNFTIKMPSPEVFNMIKENFDDADDYFIDYILSSIQGNVLKQSIKEAVVAFYKKKKPNA